MDRSSIYLYAGHTPYVDFNVKDVQLFIPFKHTIEFFEKHSDFDQWTIDDGDYDGFTDDHRTIRPWEWTIMLDRGYKHMTSISCANECVHGNKLSIHTYKGYRNNDGHTEMSINIHEDGPLLFERAKCMVDEVRLQFPERFRDIEYEAVRMNGRVCIYHVRGCKYNHR